MYGASTPPTAMSRSFEIFYRVVDMVLSAYPMRRLKGSCLASVGKAITAQSAKGDVLLHSGFGLQRGRV